MATYCGKSKRTQLRLVEHEDAEFILALRINPELNQHISQVEDSLEKQQEWIKEYKEREKNKTEFYWIIEDINGNACGLLRLYGRSFKDNTIEGGSWILLPNSPSYLAYEAALLAFIYGFSLGIQTMKMEHRKANKASLHKFEYSMGSVKSGEDELNIYYELTKEAFDITKETKLKRYFARYF